MPTPHGLSQAILAYFRAADAEARELNPTERREMQVLIDEAEELLGTTKSLGGGRSPNIPPVDFARLNGLSAPIGGGLGLPFGAFPRSAGPGDVFVASSGYKSIKDPTARPQRWSTGVVELGDGGGYWGTKGTLLEPGVGGPGGGLVPPYYQPGVVQKLFEPLSVMDLLPSTPTTASQIRYVVEGTALSGAAGVPEAGEKPESALAFSEAVEQIRKIATLLPVSDELLPDSPSIQAYLNTRLVLFVEYEEERQVLRGAGAESSELVGIFNRPELMSYGRGTADNNAVALLKAAAGFRGTVHLDADICVLHPDNALATRLLTDNQGQFYGGGPYGGAYGGSGMVPMLGAPLWGMRVAISSMVGRGTALIGSSQAAMIYRRGGRTVEASNSHLGYFATNLTALRAESRLGVATYRPFVQVTGLS